MDVFTDVDIFKAIVDATVRGVAVYVLLDDSHLKCFLTMAENHDVKLQQLRVSTAHGLKHPCDHFLDSNFHYIENYLFFRGCRCLEVLTKGCTLSFCTCRFYI